MIDEETIAQPVDDTEEVPISTIRLDGGTQMRERGTNPGTVKEYAELMGRGVNLPPITVYRDPEGILWLADGFQRVEAATVQRRETIRAEVWTGSRREAQLKAMKANGKHGLPRTNADKRKAVLTLLEDEEWRGWSDGQLAAEALVSDRFVASLRKIVSPNGSEMGARLVKRDGKTFPMNTAKIGAQRKKPASPSSTVAVLPVVEAVALPVDSIAESLALPTDTEEFTVSESPAASPVINEELGHARNDALALVIELGRMTISEDARREEHDAAQLELQAAKADGPGKGRIKADDLERLAKRDRIIAAETRFAVATMALHPLEPASDVHQRLTAAACALARLEDAAGNP